jgi:hypothetical protein
MKTIADVNVHSASFLLTKCAIKCFLKLIVHPVEKGKWRIAPLIKIKMAGFGISLQQKEFSGKCRRFADSEWARYDPGP